MSGLDDATLRRLIRALPGTSEATHGGHPDFRVGGKVFAGYFPEQRRLTLNVTPDEQALLVETQGSAYASVGGAWGARGWTSVALDHVDASSLASALLRAWRNTAPKTLLIAAEER